MNYTPLYLWPEVSLHNIHCFITLSFNLENKKLTFGHVHTYENIFFLRNVEKWDFFIFLVF